MTTPSQNEQLRAAGLPLIVTSELLSIWQEGSPSKYKKLVDEGKLMARLKSLKRQLVQANEYRNDPEMMHVSLTEKMQMAELPLTL
jgi:hypothetical protein